MPSTSKEPLSAENLEENPTDTGNDAVKDVIIILLIKFSFYINFLLFQCNLILMVRNDCSNGTHLEVLFMYLTYI